VSGSQFEGYQLPSLSLSIFLAYLVKPPYGRGATARCAVVLVILVKVIVIVCTRGGRPLVWVSEWRKVPVGIHGLSDAKRQPPLPEEHLRLGGKVSNTDITTS
jgi:hypothetical protein